MRLSPRAGEGSFVRRSLGCAAGFVRLLPVAALCLFYNLPGLCLPVVVARG